MNCKVFREVDVIKTVTNMDYHIFKREIIHSDYGTKENVLEINRYLEKLQTGISNLQITQPGTSYGWKDWEKKKEYNKGNEILCRPHDRNIWRDES